MSNERAAALRAFRAYADLEQKDVATSCGISGRTLYDAERGVACSDRSWSRLTSFYATRGLHWREGDGGELGRILVLTMDHDSA